MTSVADVPNGAVKLVEIGQSQLRQHVDGLVRDAVEDTLNALLDAEADVLCGARKYERSPDRVDYRAGSYSRQFHTKAGEVELRVPKLRRATFESQVIECYKRRETSVEEALAEMYLSFTSL
jgi:putative transposase